ncbi:MAG: hypothetical protein ABSB15_02845 [Bryobacteraceae bacterium]|jgi:hypothetical protein
MVKVNITGVTSQPPGPVLPNAGAPVRLSHPGPPSADSIGTLLGQLATPSIQNLLRSHPAPELLDGLIRAAGEAVAAHDIPRALRSITEWVRLNPEAADSVAHEPSLQPIQNEIRGLLVRIGHDARMSAEAVVTNATQLVDGRTQINLIPGGLDAPCVLALANRFYETGQLANYLRAESLGRVVIAAYEGAPAPSGGNLAARFRTLWRRAPMLILLVAWLFVGVLGGLSVWARRQSGAFPGSLAFDLWGIGFLALVVLQFYATVYNRYSKNLK